MNKLAKYVSGVLACGLPALVSAAPEPSPERLVAVIDVFSGRPNPEVLLRADAVAPSAREEHAAVVARLSSACESGRALDAKQAPAPPARLGYRGVRILRQIGQDSYVPVAELRGGGLRLSPEEAASRCGRSGSEALHAADDGALEKRLVQAAFDRGLMPKTALDAALRFLTRPEESR